MSLPPRRRQKRPKSQLPFPLPDAEFVANDKGTKTDGGDSGGSLEGNDHAAVGFAGKEFQFTQVGVVIARIIYRKYRIFPTAPRVTTTN